MTALIRHIANLGLLLSFTTLAVTGVMSFILPFSITTARVHIIFGAATAILVGMHLSTRVGYFTRVAKQSVSLGGKKKPQVPRWVVAGVLVVWAGLFAASFYGTPPATGLITLGYEARHKAEIFRAAPQVVYEQAGVTNHIAAVSAEDGELVIEVQVRYRMPMRRQPAAAVWAETTRASMIQTLFVDDRVSFSDEPVLDGAATPRHHVLPMWRHGYTVLNGVDPGGEIDAVTAPTPTHSFTIEDALAADDGRVVICLEFNALGDPNDAYPDPHLGQPSLLYTAVIDLTDDVDYYLMQLTAHGGGAEAAGTRQYNFDELTTALDLVEVVLVHINRPEREERAARDEDES